MFGDQCTLAVYRSGTFLGATAHAHGRREGFRSFSLPLFYKYYIRFGGVCQLNPVADLGKFFSLSSPHLLYILYHIRRLESIFAARGSCKGAALYTAQIRIKLGSFRFLWENRGYILVKNFQIFWGKWVFFRENCTKLGKI